MGIFNGVTLSGNALKNKDGINVIVDVCISSNSPIFNLFYIIIVI